MNTCPCCSSTMLRHVRHHQVYWFCRRCWQEIPSAKPSASFTVVLAPLALDLGSKASVQPSLSQPYLK